MSFLAPLFLFAGVAVALPFWLHRLQTRSADRRPFSSTMLLETTERQVHVRKKLRYLVLLAMRAAMLILLALVFAKPIWTRATSGLVADPVATHIVLIDTSASMRRGDLFEHAMTAASDVLDSIPGGSRIQLASADARVRFVSELSADKAIHRSALAAIDTGALRLDFGEAMSAIDKLALNMPQPVILHFISDFQESGMPARFATLAGQNIAELIAHRIAADAQSNWRVEYARMTGTGVAVGVSGSGPGTAGLGVYLNDELVGRKNLVEAGRSVHEFSGLALEPGDNGLIVRIVADDDLAIDNDWYHVIENAPPAPIPLITSNRGGRAATYLETALEADSNAGYQVEVMMIGDADFRTLSRYRWALIDDLGTIDSALEATLVSFVENGGNLLAFAGAGVTARERLPVSGHRLRPVAVGAEQNAFLAVGHIDTGHPVLSRTEGWHSVNVTRNLDVDIQDGDEVLIRLDNDTPFLIEQRLGLGRILLLTSGIDNEWNDLPIRPVFVSWVVESARYLSGVENVTKSFIAGDALPLSLIGGASGQVIDPNGDTLLSLAETVREQRIRLESPGLYEVYTSRGDYLVAVNPDARESLPDSVPAATLDRWADSMQGPAQRGASSLISTEATTMELWHALLFILALLVIGESVIGNMYLGPRAES